MESTVSDGLLVFVAPPFTAGREDLSKVIDFLSHCPFTLQWKNLSAVSTAV